MKTILILCSFLLGSYASLVDRDNVFATYEIASWRNANPMLAALSPEPTGKTLNQQLVSSKIWGGDEAEPNQHPYHVLVLTQYTEGWGICSGSIISANYILTAAHCVDPGSDAGTVVVVAGAHDWTIVEPTQQELEAFDVYIHADYTTGSINADIAIVMVDTFLYTFQVSRVVLAEADIGSLVGETGRATGWGLLSQTDTAVPNYLNYADLEIISNAECNAVYGVITDNHLCTSGVSANLCSGDFGGPLIVDGEQVAVAAFSAAAGCEAGFPAGYTRISAYREWVRDVTGY